MPAGPAVPAVPDPGAGSILDEPLSKHFPPKTLKALTDGLGLHTVEDLLRHYPRRYHRRGDLTDLASLQLDEQVTVLAEISRVTTRPMRNRRGKMLEVEVTDGRGRLTLTFFGQAWRERELVVGRTGLFAGKVGEFRGKRQLAHPEYQLLADSGLLGVTTNHREDLLAADPSKQVDDAFDTVDAFAHAVIPVYPATASMPSWLVAKCVRQVLDVVGEIPDPLPGDLRTSRDLPTLDEALRMIHVPDDEADWQAAQHRLRFDEAFVLQTVLAQRRAAVGALEAVARPLRDDGVRAAFDQRLPFTLTDGQRAVGETIAADLARTQPMNRLLQGEVGSGKTIVALRAMLAVVDAGGQAALVAPTEVLAQQHHRSITAMLGSLAERGLLGGDDAGTHVVLLTGSQSTAARRQALLDIASGEAGIVIGTHALFEESVSFFDLGLVVVDEQHRFGVEQRDALRAKGSAAVPHVLVMTATPIPRTVAMTVFGDLEVSTLTELPAGRAPIATHVVPSLEQPAFLARTWQRLREEVEAGHQAFVVTPRIGGDGPDDGDLDPADLPDDEGQPAARRPPLAVLDVAAELEADQLAGLRIDVLHGRLAPDLKEAVMRRFVAGELDVLVATTVVEVGVDVPNATAMVVLDADRFGVSQLHQLRGRVGRGSAASICLLVTEAPAGSPARERLDAVAATLDGFDLAKVDLDQRREGDVLGAAQSGRRSSLRLLKVLRDEEVIVDARDAARALVESDPALEVHPVLRREVDHLVGDERAEYLEKA